MGGIGALLAPGFEHSQGSTPRQQRLQEALGGLPREQPVAKLAQHGKVKAGVRQLQPQQILPVDARANSLRRLAIGEVLPDRKSTRLNSSHSQISYAVFCL